MFYFYSILFKHESQTYDISHTYIDIIDITVVGNVALLRVCVDPDLLSRVAKYRHARFVIFSVFGNIIRQVFRG